MEKLTKEQKYQWAMKILHREVSSDFYGNITFFVEAGHIVRSKKEIVEKPENKNDLT